MYSVSLANVQHVHVHGLWASRLKLTLVYILQCCCYCPHVHLNTACPVFYISNFLFKWEHEKKLVFTTLLMYKYNPLSALFNSQNVFFGFFFKRGKVCWAQIKSLIKMCLYKQFLGDVTNNSKANHDPVCILHKCDVLTWNCQCTTESADLWKMHKQFCLYVLLTLFNTRLQ